MGKQRVVNIEPRYHGQWYMWEDWRRRRRWRNKFYTRKDFNKAKRVENRRLQAEALK